MRKSLCVPLSPEEEKASMFRNGIQLTTSTVNEYIKTVCEEDEELKLIDLNTVFTKEGIANQTLYDQHDSSGVHVNELGAKLMLENFNNFFSKNGPKRKKTLSGYKLNDIYSFTKC
ncbi:hypothetical protein FSP39_009977 [Pinctada imbricata]|uniref:Uncharacterized protein n=1 Tax=Pinctada imbricata TaxID=66713 RepID=A0AA88YX52_PINIB|nr:hypothetical protein FSP39_009977 [Pinctada imbricata]